MKLYSYKNLIKMLTMDFEPESGFTIVELLVSISLFVIIMGIVSGVFTQSMRTQRAIVALNAAISNAQLTIEQIAREARTGQNFSITGGELNFTNAKEDNVIYRLNGEAIVRGINAKFGPLTAENVLVKNLKFISAGDSSADGRPPKITIIMQIGTKELQTGSALINLQTTISSRILDG